MWHAQPGGKRKSQTLEDQIQSLSVPAGSKNPRSPGSKAQQRPEATLLGEACCQHGAGQATPLSLPGEFKIAGSRFRLLAVRAQLAMAFDIGPSSDGTPLASTTAPWDE